MDNQSSLQSLFRILNLTFLSYSYLPPRHLLNSKLRISVIYPLQKELAEVLDLPQHELKIFKMNVFCYAMIIIDHERYREVGKKLIRRVLQEVKECAILNGEQQNGQRQSKVSSIKSYKFRQCNNILHNYSNLKSILDYPRAILVPIRTKLAPQQLHFYLKWYLSLIELSFSHLHIQLYSFSINPGPQQLQKLLQYSYSQNCEQQKQQLLFEILPDNAFISILQERASKLTVSQLSQLCEVEIKEWGKIMLFSEGINGLVIWVTVDELPWLKVLPGYHELFKSPHSAYRESCKNRRKNPIKLTNQGCKGVVEVQRSDLGYSIFRHANCKIKTANEFLQRCQQQALTMYIIDFESKKGLSSEQMVSIIKQEMEFVFQIFNEQSQQSHKLKQTNEYIVCTERISELLSLDGTQLLSKLFRL